MGKLKRVALITFILALFSCTLCFFTACDDNNQDKEPTDNVISVFTVEDWEYGATPSVPTCESLHGEATFTFSTSENGEYVSNVPTNAGKYWIKAFIPAGDGYKEVSKITSFNILKADNLLTAFDDISDVDCGKAPILTATAKFGQVSFTYSTTENGVFGNAPATFTSGKYYVKATTQSNENYNSVSQTKSFSVNHKYDQEIVGVKYLSSEADCCHYAVYYKSCACGEKSDNTFENTAGGYGEHKHTESKSAVEATCCAFGYTAGMYCNDCKQYIEGHTQIAMTNNHSWVEDTEKSKEANCTEAGVKAYKCSCEGCEATKTEAGDPAKNHNVSKWTEKSKVKVDGTTKCEYTVTYEGTCANCRNTISKTEVIEYHNFYWTVTKEPTCQADGEKAEYCLDENCKYHTTAHATDVYKLPEGADGHNWIKDDETNYHCSNTGCNAKKVIASSSGNTLSGSNLTKVDEIQLSTASVSMNDAMKSSLADAELSITAEEKSKEDVLASVRDASDKEKIAKAKAVFDFTLTKNGEAQSDLGGEITIRIPYTLQPGDDPDKILVVCILENGKLEEFIATYANGFITFKTNHFSIYSVVELTPGEYCEKYNCHTEDYVNANADKFKVIAPTCTLGGYTVCLHCGEIFNKTEALGHKWNTQTVSKASCTENGLEHHSCSLCGMGYDTYTPAFGHDYVLESEIKATCCETGSMVYKCLHCNDSYTVTTVKLNHNYIVEVVQASCTENGYTKKTCHSCGAEGYTNIVPALGHQFGTAWVKTAEGHYHVCDRCGEADEMHAHTPDCDEATTEHGIHCSVCGYEIAKKLEEPTEPDEQEFIKAFDPSNFVNFTCDNPMGKQMFDYPDGLVFVENYSEYRPYILMLYNGNWYMKENGNWAMADEKDYISFVYENTVNMMTEMGKKPHRFDNGTWYVNVGERELPFYIENDKIVYQTTMDEKDTHFYDYGTTVIEVPDDLIDFIEKQGDEPEKVVQYTANFYWNGLNFSVKFYTVYTFDLEVQRDGEVITKESANWEYSDDKVCAYFNGDPLFFEIKGDELIFIDPTEQGGDTDEEFIKAFDPRNFENVTIDNPMGKQMFDYPNGLVFIDANTYPSFQIMLYDGNWYKKENGEWAKAQERDYFGFTYEYTVGSFETYKTFDHYYKDGAWIVNMYGEMEVPFYIENDKIVYQSTMSEKDSHFYDYGTTVIEVPKDLIDFIEKQGDEPTKKVQYTANFYWNGLNFSVKFYTDYKFDVEVQRDGKVITKESANWEYSDDKVCAYFNGDPLFFEIKGDELIFIDPTEQGGDEVDFSDCVYGGILKYMDMPIVIKCYEGGEGFATINGNPLPNTNWTIADDGIISVYILNMVFEFTVSEKDGKTLIEYVKEDDRELVYIASYRGMPIKLYEDKTCFLSVGAGTQEGAWYQIAEKKFIIEFDGAEIPFELNEDDKTLSVYEGMDWYQFRLVVKDSYGNVILTEPFELDEYNSIELEVNVETLVLRVVVEYTFDGEIYKVRMGLDGIYVPGLYVLSFETDGRVGLMSFDLKNSKEYVRLEPIYKFTCNVEGQGEILEGQFEFFDNGAFLLIAEKNHSTIIDTCGRYEKEGDVFTCYFLEGSEGYSFFEKDHITVVNE